MTSTVIIGAQWGDEGKGKIVDLLGENTDLVVRFNGGNNAGHTVVVKGEKYKFHLMPSGAIQGKKCVIGAGVALDPRVLKQETAQLEGKFPVDLMIDPRTQIIMPWHNSLDGAKEAEKGDKKIGTTGRGVGPCYSDRAERTGIRFTDLVDSKKLEQKINTVYSTKERILKNVYNQEMPATKEQILEEYSALGKQFKESLGDASIEVNNALKEGKNVLFEGAQGTFLDNDFGTYPYVTSSHPTAGGIFSGVGIGLQKIDRVIAIVKAYTTRVGEGPFVTELHDELGNRIRETGQEFGTTTGRPRRVGWLDIVLLRTAQRLNGFTEMALTKLDVLNGLEKIMVCTAYEYKGKMLKEFPADLEELEKCTPVYKEFKGFEVKTDTKDYKELTSGAKEYIAFIEKELGIPAKIVSVGPGREETIVR